MTKYFALPLTKEKIDPILQMENFSDPIVLVKKTMKISVDDKNVNCVVTNVNNVIKYIIIVDKTKTPRHMLEVYHDTIVPAEKDGQILSIWSAPDVKPGPEGYKTYKAKLIGFITPEEMAYMEQGTTLPKAFHLLMNVLFHNADTKHVTAKENRETKAIYGITKDQMYRTVIPRLMKDFGFAGDLVSVKTQIIEGIINRQIPVMALLFSLAQHMYDANPDMKAKTPLGIRFINAIDLGAQDRNMLIEIIDGTTGETNKMTAINAGNMKYWKKFIPAGIDLDKTNDGRMYVSVDPEQFLVKYPEYYRKDISADFWDADCIELILVPKSAIQPGTDHYDKNAEIRVFANRNKVYYNQLNKLIKPLYMEQAENPNTGELYFIPVTNWKKAKIGTDLGVPRIDTSKLTETVITDDKIVVMQAEDDCGTCVRVPAGVLVNDFHRADKCCAQFSPSENVTNQFDYRRLKVKIYSEKDKEAEANAHKY